MQPETMRVLLAQMGLSQRAFARLAGIDDRLVRRMMSGVASVDEDVAALLLLIAAWRRRRQEKRPGTEAGPR